MVDYLALVLHRGYYVLLNPKGTAFTIQTMLKQESEIFLNAYQLSAAT